jgi:hypothetical protein
MSPELLELELLELEDEVLLDPVELLELLALADEALLDPVELLELLELLELELIELDEEELVAPVELLELELLAREPLDVEASMLLELAAPKLLGAPDSDPLDVEAPELPVLEPPKLVELESAELPALAGVELLSPDLVAPEPPDVDLAAPEPLARELVEDEPAPPCVAPLLPHAAPPATATQTTEPPRSTTPIFRAFIAYHFPLCPSAPRTIATRSIQQEWTIASVPGEAAKESKRYHPWHNSWRVDITPNLRRCLSHDGGEPSDLALGAQRRRIWPLRDQFPRISRIRSYLLTPAKRRGTTKTVSAS